MKKQKLKFTICKFIAAFAVGLLTITLSENFTQVTEPTAKASEPIIDPAYLQEYNQVQKLQGYTVTLTHGAYSEQTRTGLCVFEIEKDEGNIEPPVMCDDQFGNPIITGAIGDDNKNFTIELCSTGSITNRGFMKGNKLIVYTNFEARPSDPREIEDYNLHQITLFAGNGKGDKADIELFEECMNGKYAFKLDNNASGKEYKVNQSTTLSLSYFGVLIESDQRWKDLKVEIEINDKKETLIDTVKEPGNYAESCFTDDGVQEFKYYYSFDDINYDIDKIEAIYLNGKKLSD